VVLSVQERFFRVSFSWGILLGLTQHCSRTGNRFELLWKPFATILLKISVLNDTKGCAMPSTAIMDVAIGIVFVYLFLSLICTVVNEGIASIFSLRAKNLVRGINSLFSDSKIADGRHFVDAIYAHGLVRGLFPDPSPAELKKAASLVAGSSADQPPAPDAPATDAPAQKPMADHAAAGLPFVVAMIEKKMKVGLPSYIPTRTFATALTDVIAPPDPNNPKPRSLEEVRQAIAKLPESPAQQALLSVVASTQKDVAEFQEKVENWFNDSMDRAAGWYKRRAQTILLGIALVVTLALNVDSVKLAQGLWANPTAAKATADLAERYVSNATVKTSDDLKQQAQSLADVGQQLPFAFGWGSWLKAKKTANAQNVTEGSLLSHVGTKNTVVAFWAESLVGWIITILALSLGAPFWFDILNKFMVVRSTVKPQEKSQTEKSKDA
jgi:hypothetical protein